MTRNSLGPQHGATRRHAEILDRHLASPIRSGDDGRGAVGDERRDRVGRGRGVAEVAAEAGAALDLHAADEGGRVNEAGECARDHLVVVHAVAGHGCAEHQAAAAIKEHLGQFGDALDIDNHAGCGAPFTQRHQQIGAATEDRVRRPCLGQAASRPRLCWRHGHTQKLARSTSLWTKEKSERSDSPQAHPKAGQIRDAPVRYVHADRKCTADQRAGQRVVADGCIPWWGQDFTCPRRDMHPRVLHPLKEFEYLRYHSGIRNSSPSRNGPRIDYDNCPR